MRLILSTILPLLTLTCGDAASYNIIDEVKVGPTTILQFEDALYYDDLNIILDAMQHALDIHMNYDTKAVADVFAVKVELHPCNRPFYWYGQQLGPEVVGLYDVHGRILIRTCYANTSDTALHHEFWQHRFPHVRSGNPNPGHTPDWVQFEVDMRKRTTAYLWRDTTINPQ